MNTQGLQTDISRFERVLAAQLPLNMADSPVAHALRELYAMKTANAVFSSLRALHPKEVATALKAAQTEDDSSARSSLPGLTAVGNAAPRLLQAVAGEDGNAAVKALEEMGVFTLCPPVDQQFRRLEFCTGRVVGRARLVPLVELAILALELATKERAVIYLADAHALVPEPPELHDLHTVAGTIALEAGKITEAKKCLAESIRICQEDEFAYLTCKVHAPNLMLAEKLLEHGQATAVVKYLAQCQKVWTYEAKRIACWINAIQHGQKPDFLAPSALTIMWDPAVKMRHLVVRSSFLTATIDPEMQKLNQGARAQAGEMRAKYKSDIIAAIKGKLGTEKN